MKRSAFKEILWIVPIAAISLFISYRVSLLINELSNFQNTYFVAETEITTLTYFLEIFSLLSFLVYGIKEAFGKYRSLLANSVIILAGAGLILTQVSIHIANWWTYIAMRNASAAAENTDWTVNPPSNDVSTSGGNYFSIETIYNLVQHTFLILVIGLIIFVSIRTGILLAAKKQTSSD